MKKPEHNAQVGRCKTSGRIRRMSLAAVGACEPVHQESVAVGADEVRVFRCSWGWCVKRDGIPYRARTLLEAFESACGGRLDQTLFRDLVAAMERSLNTRHAASEATVSTTVALPHAALDSAADR